MMQLWKYVSENMMRTPEQEVREGGASTTYEQLCAFAQIFSEKITGQNNIIFCRSEMAASMALLACIAADKTAIPLAMRYGEKHYMKIIDRVSPDCIISDMEGELKVYPLDSVCDRNSENGSEHPSVILFTSGSTGAPKGVMLSEENLMSNIEGIKSYLPMGEYDTILISRPIYHSSVLSGELLSALCSGTKIIFSSDAFQPLNIINLLKKHKITIFGGTPTLISSLSRFVRRADELFVRTLSISGECMSEGAAQYIRQAFPKARIYCGYGLSEASPRVAYLPADLFDMYPTAAGIPLPNVQTRIADESGADVEDDAVGELLVRGENVMLGYFNDSELTQRVLDGGWLHTGDLARYAPNGLLYIKGRKDDMMIRAGMNVYPAEIENEISKDERVREVCVYGYEQDGTQQIGMLISGDIKDIDEVSRICRERLASYQMPSKIKIVDNVEALSGGKKKRKLIEEDR